MIGVLIVDDQALIREGLAMMLALYDQIQLLGQAAHGQEALDLLAQGLEPDVILMDIRMPVMDGVEATKWIKEKYPQIKVLILTTFNEDQYIFDGLRNGADGYLLKDIPSERLLGAIETVYRGDMLLQPSIAQRVITSLGQEQGPRVEEMDEAWETLTKREKEVAIFVGQGKSNEEISRELFIAQGTVKNHISNILDKLDLRDRTQLALWLAKK